MSNTIRYEITQLQLDDNQNVSDEKDYVLTSNFTASNKGMLPPIINGATWITIPFGSVTVANRVKIISDQYVEVVINGSTAVINDVKDLNMSGSFTSVSIQNLSGNTANIEFAIYG